MKHTIATIKDYVPVSLVTYTNKQGDIALGYNHVLGVHNGQTCTQEEADKWLWHDIQALQVAIGKLIHHPLNSNQLRALVSLVHDISLDTFSKSAMLRYINNGQFTFAAKEFLVYNTNGRAVSIQVLRRRQSEQNIFNLQVSA